MSGYRTMDKIVDELTDILGPATTDDQLERLLQVIDREKLIVANRYRAKLGEPARVLETQRYKAPVRPPRALKVTPSEPTVRAIKNMTDLFPQNRGHTQNFTLHSFNQPRNPSIPRPSTTVNMTEAGDVGGK